LNYGNNDIFNPFDSALLAQDKFLDFRLRIANNGLRALALMFETEIEFLRFLFSLLPDSIHSSVSHQTQSIDDIFTQR